MAAVAIETGAANPPPGRLLPVGVIKGEGKKQGIDQGAEARRRRDQPQQAQSSAALKRLPYK